MSILKDFTKDIVYSKYELQFYKGNELDSILLNKLEFNLLIDNERGQNQIIQFNNYGILYGLVAYFRNSKGTTITINFNTKKVNVYSFLEDIDNLLILKEIDYKEIYDNLKEF